MIVRTFIKKLVSGANDKVSSKRLKLLDILFYVLLLLILGKALFIRLSLPHIAFIDSDISGYLDPALKFIDGKGFTAESARGLCYPFFVLVNIMTGGSIDTVALSQHLMAVAGLALIALAFIESFRHEITLSNASCILAGMMLIGWDNDMIILEHTIRPEGLSIFFSGAIFFLLQRLLNTPVFKVYISLFFTVVVICLSIPKFFWGGMFIILYASYRYIRCQPASFKWARWLILLMIAWYTFDTTLDGQKNFFLAKNYFYVNCRYIGQSCLFEKCFTSTEQNAIRYAVKCSYEHQNALWPILGFGVDDMIYGPVSANIEKRFGTDLYGSVMSKSLVFCFPQLLHKIVRQIKFYYYEINNSARIPNTFTIDCIPILGYSGSCLDGLSKDSPAYIDKYRDEVNVYLAARHENINSGNHYSYFIWLKEMYLSTLLIFFAAIYSLVRIIRQNADTLTILFVTHALVLLTIALIHTLDIVRYAYSLFPLFIIINTLVFCQMGNKLIFMVRKITGYQFNA